MACSDADICGGSFVSSSDMFLTRCSVLLLTVVEIESVLRIRGKGYALVGQVSDTKLCPDLWIRKAGLWMTIDRVETRALSQSVEWGKGQVASGKWQVM